MSQTAPAAAMYQKTHTLLPKGVNFWTATCGRLHIFWAIQLLVLLTVEPAFSGEPAAQIPLFRHVDPSAIKVQAPAQKALTLIVDPDFAPWSFASGDGSMKGISVDLALAACKAMSATCTVKPVAFNDLLPALQRGEGDVVVSGIRPTATVLDSMSMTRPYFMSFGRFVARLGSPLQATDTRAMAGRRVGAVKGTSHDAWLVKYYSRSALSSFATFDEMTEALRTGSIDAAFGDAMQLGFWMKGTRSRSCCAVLGKAFIDRETFSRNLVFLAKKKDSDLVSVLDQSLDQLEANGTTAQVFSAYLPGPVW
jgi:polar amino acid transport system substrate-binding protein